MPETWTWEGLKDTRWFKTILSRIKSSIYYTGIGSRKTPEEICILEQRIACFFKTKLKMRSGGAEGSDSAFEEGIDNGNMEIYLPWKTFGNRDLTKKHFHVLREMKFKIIQKAMMLVKLIAPYWGKLSHAVMQLYTRNMFQILGMDLCTPSAFVIYYAPPDKETIKGGTRIAVELAWQLGIPTCNLFYEENRNKIIDLLNCDDANFLIQELKSGNFIK